MFHGIAVEINRVPVEKTVEINIGKAAGEWLKKNLPFRGVFSTPGQRRLKKRNLGRFISTGSLWNIACCEGRG